MVLNFMQFGQVVLSGNGFDQSMAYHAFQVLSVWSFALQFIACSCSIALGYVLRIWALRRMTQLGLTRPLLSSYVQSVGPATVAVALMYVALMSGQMVGLGSDDLMLLSRVFRLSLWVYGIRNAGWVLRHVLHPHGILRIFLHLIEWFSIGAVILTFLGLLLPAVSAINSVEFSIGSQVFRGANIVTGIMLAVVALTVAGQVAQLVERLLGRYARKQKLQANDALIITRLFSVGIFVLTVVAVMVQSGVGLTTLAAFAGAMGIGLSFGLQDFVANFVSGLSVLLERALKVGDYVTINDITGRVVRMSSRAVVIRDRVGTESLIPNRNVIKGVLQNYTLSNDDFRMTILLKIAEISDYPRAKALILDALKTSSRVLASPGADVLICGFGADEVKLEISFWINDFHHDQNELVSELLYEVAMRLKAAGVPLALDGAQSYLAAVN